MLQVSLHAIAIHAPVGLYPEEAILGNDFEADVDIWLPTTPGEPLPFADYTIIHSIVKHVFTEGGHQLLEHVALDIHTRLLQQFPATGKAKVAIRKLHPPVDGEVAYSQVCYEE